MSCPDLDLVLVMACAHILSSPATLGGGGINMTDGRMHNPTCPLGNLTAEN